MSQPDNTSYWIGALSALGTAGAMVIGAFRWLSGYARKSELREAIKAIERAQQQRHQENLTHFRELFERTREIDMKTARIEGQLSGRYPNLGKR